MAIKVIEIIIIAFSNRIKNNNIKAECDIGNIKYNTKIYNSKDKLGIQKSNAESKSNRYNNKNS